MSKSELVKQCYGCELAEPIYPSMARYVDPITGYLKDTKRSKGFVKHCIITLEELREDTQSVPPDAQCVKPLDFQPRIDNKAKRFFENFWPIR